MKEGTGPKVVEQKHTEKQNRTNAHEGGRGKGLPLPVQMYPNQAGGRGGWANANFKLERTAPKRPDTNRKKRGKKQYKSHLKQGKKEVPKSTGFEAACTSRERKAGCKRVAAASQQKPAS